MESMTKSKLNEEQIREITADVFGAGNGAAEIEELTGGYFNAAYRVLLADGRETILKISPADDTETMTYERGIMRTEVETLKLAREKGLAPVPEVYAYNTGRRVVPNDYFFMEKVRGIPFNEIREGMSPEARGDVERQLGRYNRQINDMVGSRFGLYHDPFGRTPGTWREAFTGMIGDVLDDAVRLKAPMPIGRGELERGIEELLPALDAVKEPRLVHWDLWEGNVFVENGKITALIDWERALWGDPLMEFHFRYIAEEQLRRVEGNEAFYEGYGGFYESPNELERKKLYDLYLDLIYFVECFSRKYTSEDHLKWAHNQIVEGWKRFSGR
ncbi:aminoglycoside phosphotransferase family protein [Paenibacillus sp. HN-1]|nr:aminoglycoside phosphotransferase family protein [Paenibacillus sp. CGMCC 1.18879]MBY9087287.1 aminoglycoside phosphotransferase family protein [Paenibacillus sinensis]